MISQRATVVTLCIVAIIVGLMMFADGGRDTETDDQANVSAGWLRLSRRSREKADSLSQVGDSLGHVADRAVARAAQLKAQQAPIRVDSAKVVVADDTTTYRIAVRPTDNREFMVPDQLIKWHELQLSVVDSAMRAERLARVYLRDFVVPMKDTLIDQLGKLSDSRGKEVGLWKAKANPLCGRKCVGILSVLGTLTVVKLVSR